MSNRLIRAHFARELATLGYGAAEPQWALSYCQGDGMAFYGRIQGDDLATLARRLLRGQDLAAFTRAHRKDGELISLDIRDRGGRNHHYASMAVDWSEYFDTDDERFTAPERAALQRLHSAVIADVAAVSVRLEKEGYAIHEAGSPVWILGHRRVDISRSGRERGILRRYRHGRFEVAISLLDDPDLDPEVLMDGCLGDFVAGRRIYAAVQVFITDTVARGTWGRAIERGVVDTRDLAEVRRIAKRLFRRAKQAARLRLQRVAA